MQCCTYQVGNCHVSAHEARESRKAAQQLLSPRQVQEACDYDNEEIVQQSGVPGMGLSGQPVGLMSPNRACVFFRSIV